MPQTRTRRVRQSGKSAGALGSRADSKNAETERIDPSSEILPCNPNVRDDCAEKLAAVFGITSSMNTAQRAIKEAVATQTRFLLAMMKKAQKILLLLVGIARENQHSSQRRGREAFAGIALATHRHVNSLSTLVSQLGKRLYVVLDQLWTHVRNNRKIVFVTSLLLCWGSLTTACSRESDDARAASTSGAVTKLHALRENARLILERVGRAIGAAVPSDTVRQLFNVFWDTVSFGLISSESYWNALLGQSPDACTLFRQTDLLRDVVRKENSSSPLDTLAKHEATRDPAAAHAELRAADVPNAHGAGSSGPKEHAEPSSLGAQLPRRASLLKWSAADVFEEALAKERRIAIPATFAGFASTKGVLGNRDAHGCYAFADEAWDGAKNTCVSIWNDQPPIAKHRAWARERIKARYKEVHRNWAYARDLQASYLYPTQGTNTPSAAVTLEQIDALLDELWVVRNMFAGRHPQHKVDADGLAREAEALERGDWRSFHRGVLNSTNWDSHISTASAVADPLSSPDIINMTPTLGATLLKEISDTCLPVKQVWTRTARTMARRSPLEDALRPVYVRRANVALRRLRDARNTAITLFRTWQRAIGEWDPEGLLALQKRVGSMRNGPTAGQLVHPDVATRRREIGDARLEEIERDRMAARYECRALLVRLLCAADKRYVRDMRLTDDDRVEIRKLVASGLKHYP